MKEFIGNKTIAIIGLGYVGLPLAVEFGKKYRTIGYDININRINQLSMGIDNTRELEEKELALAEKITYTNDVEKLKEASIYIVTVPTPIDEYKKPDFTPLINASKLLSNVIKKNDVIIYESTVYPGATEEVCVPILEKYSNLEYNKDFFIGYSPERINPGDKKYRLTAIKKVTSGSTPEIADFVDSLYSSIILAGTYKAESIKIAEAAKVIENTQRDVNIALMNELSLIFNKMGIDTNSVLKAAGTKWNFLPFSPGLVGGHCIGVDPYYLTYKAQAIGYHPEVILSGRRINDSMGEHVATMLIKTMIKEGINIVSANILILGLTFKENCPDIRNTKVIDIINELKQYNINVEIYDPWVNHEDAFNEYNVLLQKELKNNYYDGVVIAVPHKEFLELGIDRINLLTKERKTIFDLKSIFEKSQSNIRL